MGDRLKRFTTTCGFSVAALDDPSGGKFSVLDTTPHSRGRTPDACASQEDKTFNVTPGLGQAEPVLASWNEDFVAEFLSGLGPHRDSA